MTRWSLGAAEVDQLIAERELEQVQASQELAARLLEEATAHLGSAEKLVGDDPAGSLQLAYDCARKSAAALLAAQGLRATSAGGHIALCRAVKAQFGDAFTPLDRIRRTRNQAEYPDVDSPDTTIDDARHTIDQSVKMLEGATGLLNSGQLGVFTPDR